MAQRYAGAPIIIDVAGGRQISEQYFTSISAVGHVLLQEARRLRKILCFANSRNAVEHGAALLKAAVPHWPVMVHHGSLHQREREATEAALRDTARWMCVATTTLEVGIDVGDVDAVLLLEPPWSVASLLQRIGRANRRSETVNVLALSGNAEQRLIYEEQFRRARLGLLDHSTYQPDLSVIVQQFFAMLSGSPGGLADGPLRLLFSDFASEAVINTILDHLETAGHVQRRHGQWFASNTVMDLATQGKVYSNIPDSSVKAVIDQSTGQQVGEVSDAVDSVFILAGRPWQVTQFSHNAIYVQPTSTTGGIALFQFHNDQGAFASYLPPTLRLIKTLREE
jgi:ATP-dependent Lhr-like helicase